ncbi:MAG: serine/threonine protein kinase, partial [Pirellulaceae bacterium]
MNSESIFNAALAITDAKKRFTFINEQPLLPALRDELLALLAAHDELGDFLENPALLNHADTLDAFDTSEIGPNGSAPKECGDYVILKEIARGGMGIVYRARHKELGRIVALKMIQSSPLSFAGSVERFETETRTIASLSHPNIVPIYDIGRHEGRPFFTMQLVAGRTLAEELQDDPLDPTEAAELARQVASAIACCHAANIIHRDLKPANILLATAFPDSSSLSRVGSLHTTYMAMVTDFGLAKATDVNDGPTLTGQIIGTPSFMPPEQARGDGEMTTSADIYSLGAVLYAMLTGRPPFHASKPVETLRQVLY